MCDGLMFEFNSELGKVSDVITVEIEHVNVEGLQYLEDEGHVVNPSPSAIKLIQVTLVENFSDPFTIFVVGSG